MFTELSQIMGKATINLVISKTGPNELTVSILPVSAGCDIVPAIIKGNPVEIDASFGNLISGLIQDSESMILKKSAATKSMKDKVEVKSTIHPKPVALKTEPVKETVSKSVPTAPVLETVKETSDILSLF